MPQLTSFLSPFWNFQRETVFQNGLELCKWHEQLGRRSGPAKARASRIAAGFAVLGRGMPCAATGFEDGFQPLALSSQAANPAWYRRSCSQGCCAGAVKHKSFLSLKHSLSGAVLCLQAHEALEDSTWSALSLCMQPFFFPSEGSNTHFIIVQFAMSMRVCDWHATSVLHMMTSGLIDFRKPAATQQPNEQSRCSIRLKLCCIAGCLGQVLTVCVRSGRDCGPQSLR